MFTVRRLPLLFGFGAACLTAGALALGLGRASASQLLSRGLAALQRGDAAAAQQLAARLEQRGSAQHARLLRGQVRVWEGRALLEGAADGSPAARRPRLPSRARDAFRGALEELTRVQDEGAVGVEATVLAAECLVHLEKLRLAADALRLVVQRQPEQKEAHRLLAAIYIDLNAPAPAIEHLREWGRLDPDDGRPHRWIGFLSKYYRGSHWEEAAAAYREACRRRLTPAVREEVLRELAETLIDGLGDYKAGLAVLDEGPTAGTEGPERLVLRAECHWGLGQPDRAVALLDRALEAEPNLLRAALARAKIHLADGNARAALPLLERAVQIDPHDVGARLHLMQAYRGVGDAARAEQHRKLFEASKGYKEQLTKLHEEVGRDAWDDQLRYRIAELCLKVNRPAEARLWLRAALACNRGNRQARELLDRLAAAETTPAVR
jgi:tetratricopeptide (TPR) repeat protein